MRADGQLYRLIRRRQRAGDTKAVQELIQSAEGEKPRALRQLLLNSWLMKCFDRLDPFDGLWDAFSLGWIPTILSWRSREEIENYLGELHRGWSDALGSDHGSFLDSGTAALVGCLAPRRSSEDRSIIKSLGEEGRIFLTALPAERAVIVEKLCAQEFILTFESFFGHIKVLEAVVRSVRWLIPGPARHSLRHSILACYDQSTECASYPLEFSESISRYADIAPADRALVSYLQVCLGGYRRFPLLTRFTPRCRAGKRKRAPFPQHSDDLKAPHALARLARSVCLKSDHIEELAREPALDPYKFLLVQVDGASSWQPVGDKEWTTNHCRLSLKERFGRPTEDEFKNVCEGMFCHNVVSKVEGAKNINAFGVQALILRCFYSDIIRILQGGASEYARANQTSSSTCTDVAGSQHVVVIEDTATPSTVNEAAHHFDILGEGHSVSTSLLEAVSSQSNQDKIRIYKVEHAASMTVHPQDVERTLLDIDKSRCFMGSTVPAQCYAIYTAGGQLKSISQFGDETFQSLGNSMYRNMIFAIDLSSEDQMWSIFGNLDAALEKRGRGRERHA